MQCWAASLTVCGEIPENGFYNSQGIQNITPARHTINLDDTIIQRRKVWLWQNIVYCTVGLFIMSNRPRPNTRRGKIGVSHLRIFDKKHWVKAIYYMPTLLDSSFSRKKLKNFTEHGSLGAAGWTLSALVQPLREHSTKTHLRTLKTFFEWWHFPLHTLD